MSHRRTSFRRALAGSLALMLGPVAIAVPAVTAQAVASPTGVDVPLPTAASSVAFDDGRLLTGRSGTNSVRVNTVTVPLVGQVTLDAGSTDLTSGAVASADRRTFATSAGLDVLPSGSRVLVRRGSVTVLDLPAPTGTSWTVDVSGPYVRVGTRVLDVRRGATAILTLPSTTRTSALHGSRLVWSESDGSVRLRDLASSAATRTLRAGTKNCTTCAQQVATNGVTVAYGKPGGQLSLWDVGTRGGRSNVLSLAGVERFRLGDGFLATASPDGLGLHRFNDPLTLSTPTVHLDGVHVVDLAFDGHAFAFVRADGTVRVEQLPDAVDGERRPVVLASKVSGAFSPNRDGFLDAWSASFVLTERVTSWRLEIVAPATNSPVANFTSAPLASPTANVAVTWKPAGGPQGSYRWTLTGANADGEVTTVTGNVVTGVVNLRRTNSRTVAVRAPLDLAAATRSVRTPVSWRPAGAFPAGVRAASYDVEYRTVRTRKGKRAFGPPARMFSRTTRTSAGFAGKKGVTYQFRARSRDSVGLVGPWSSWALSHTPLDDRSSAVRWSGGWKAKRVSGAWAGTQHVATTSGRSARVTSSTSGFALVMRTCASCGAVKVYVDGKLRTVVALTGTTSVRRTVYSVSFGRPGRHTIKVVTVVKGKQKKVALDAIVVRH